MVAWSDVSPRNLSVFVPVYAVAPAIEARMLFRLALLNDVQP